MAFIQSQTTIIYAHIKGKIFLHWSFRQFIYSSCENPFYLAWLQIWKMGDGLTFRVTLSLVY